MYLLNDACAEKQFCYGPIWSIDPTDEVVPPLASLYAAAVFFFIVFLYLDAVLPREFGVPKHPLFCFSCCRKPKKVEDDHSPDSADIIEPVKFGASIYDSRLPPVPLKRKLCSVVADNEAHLLKKEDQDVDAERTRVYDQNYDPDAPLVLHNLRKVYPAKPPKVAVKSFCLVVDEGECFALLGENGAGKTTTISMLTGLFPPTAGWATVGGFDGS